MPIAALDFVNDRLLKIGATEFDLDWSKDIAHKESTASRYVLLKSPKVIQTYADYFAGNPPTDVFEIGIQKGGSCALFNLMWRPQRHVAIELRSSPVGALDELAASVARDGRRFRHALGVDQGDAGALLELVRAEFGGDKTPTLDTVIDDASHLYEPSKASFNTLFPLVRVGGTYVIEDWGWAHWGRFSGRSRALARPAGPVQSRVRDSHDGRVAPGHRQQRRDDVGQHADQARTGAARPAQLRRVAILSVARQAAEHDLSTDLRSDSANLRIATNVI